MDAACGMQHVVMLISKPHGKGQEVGMGGDSSSEADITTGLGHTALDVWTQTLASLAASCPG